MHEVFPIILCQIDHFQGPSLTAQQHLGIAKAKARRPVFVFNDDSGNALIFEECQELRSIITPYQNAAGAGGSFPAPLAGPLVRNPARALV